MNVFEERNGYGGLLALYPPRGSPGNRKLSLPTPKKLQREPKGATKG